MAYQGTDDQPWLEATIEEGMAKAIWADAWANHVEERDCTSLSGCDIMDAMPQDIGDAATEWGEALRAKFEEHTVSASSKLTDLFVLAMASDGVDVKCATYDDSDLEAAALDFGHYLAMQAMGHGVSWFDSHAHHGGLDVVMSQVHSEDDGTVREQACEACPHCTDEPPVMVVQTYCDVEGRTAKAFITDGDARVHLAINEENEHSTYAPLGWANSASISANAEADEIVMSVSTGDPRGAMTWTVRRTPDGKILLHVPQAGEHHETLVELHPGTLALARTLPAGGSDESK